MQATISAKSGGQATCVREKTNWALIIIRILTAFAGLMIFFPEVNPGRLMSDINANTSLFTAAISYSTLTDSFARPLRMGWVQPWHFYLIMGGCALLMLGIILSAIGACMSLGNHRMKRAAVKLPLIGSVLMLGGIGTLVYLNSILPALEKADRLKLMTPTGAIVFWAVLGGLLLVFSIVSMVTIPKDMEEKMEMEEKYRLFLMFLPVLILTVIFCYLPLYGWRYAFFDYKVGDALSSENFVGLKWFSYLFSNGATRNDLVRAAQYADYVWLGHCNELAADCLRRFAGGTAFDEVPARCADPDDDSELHLMGSGVRDRVRDFLHRRLHQLLPAQRHGADRHDRLSCQRGLHLAQDAAVGHMEGLGLERYCLHRGHCGH